MNELYDNSCEYYANMNDEEIKIKSSTIFGIDAIEYLNLLLLREISISNINNISTK